MSSNLEDMQAGLARYYGPQTGIVTRIDDPRGKHRIRARIPGIAEPDTDWLWPLTMGGGSAQRGGHVMPAVGSDVVVLFHQGDPNGRGWYAGGNWGEPIAGDEMPGDVKDAASDHPELVQSFELGGLRLTIDERAGQRSLQVADLTNPNPDGSARLAFVMDREQGAILIQATSLIQIKCIGAVVIDALEIQINGRRVATSPAMI